jgi:hypothetical protein
MLLVLRLQLYAVVGAVVTSYSSTRAFEVRRTILISKLLRHRFPCFPTRAIALPMDFDESSSSTVKRNAAPLIGAPKVGVLLLNLGGPETGEDVEGTFLITFRVCRSYATLLSHFCTSIFWSRFSI